MGLHVKDTSIDIHAFSDINHYHSVKVKKKEIISQLKWRNTLERFYKRNLKSNSQCSKMLNSDRNKYYSL